MLTGKHSTVSGMVTAKNSQSGASANQVIGKGSLSYKGYMSMSASSSKNGPMRADRDMKVQRTNFAAIVPANGQPPHPLHQNQSSSSSSSNPNVIQQQHPQSAHDGLVSGHTHSGRANEKHNHQVRSKSDHASRQGKQKLSMTSTQLVHAMPSASDADVGAASQSQTHSQSIRGSASQKP